MKKIALASLCVLAFAAAGVVVSEYMNPRPISFMSKFENIRAAPEVHIAAQPVAAEVSTASIEVKQVYPEETVSPKEIRELFEKMDFDTLTAKLEIYQAMFEKDFRYEYHVYDAFQAFVSTAPEYEILFDAWSEAAPDSFAPYLARATYYQELGSNSRGGKLAAETSESQFAGMGYHYQRAEMQALKALKINPNVVRAVTILINIRMNYTDREAMIALEEHAAGISPNAFIFRINYMLSLLPRWGGSYDAMDDYVRSCEKFFRYNPRLETLKGFKYNDMGFYYRKKEDYSRAIDMYNKALSFGPNQYYLRERGRTFYWMDDYKSAMADLNQAVSLRSTIAANYHLRSKIHYATENYEAALDDFDKALEISPTDNSVIEDMQWCCDNLMNRGHQIFKTDRQGAIDKYSMALRFNSQAYEVWYWRGVAHMKAGRYDLARDDVKQSIELNPNHFESYRIMDAILARDRNWDDIIEYWNEFLQLNPNHADALMERAGTYYHKGNMELSIQDMKRSCELGNSSACNWYKKMRH